MLDPSDVARSSARAITTRIAYDTVAEDYADALAGQLAGLPVERDVLASFAAAVEPGAPVLDVGSGPGHVTAYLADLGLRIRGLDLSPAMVETARRIHPSIGFEVGDLERLDAAELGGLVAWYSLIHTPPAELPAVLAGFRRASREGAMLLLAFQVGDELRHISHGYGHDVSLDAWRLDPEDVARQLAAAGFDHVSSRVREPGDGESVAQAFLTARVA